MEAIQQAEGLGISIQGQCVNKLRLADDVDLLEKDRDRLQSNLVNISRARESMELKISVNKTKTVAFR